MASSSAFGKAIVYGGFTLVALMVGIVTVPQLRTSHHLNGSEVPRSWLDQPEFIRKNAKDIRTKTVLDYDDVISIASPGTSDLFPPLVFWGSLSTPSYVTMGILGLHSVAGLLAAFGFLQFVYWLQRR